MKNRKTLKEFVQFTLVATLITGTIIGCGVVTAPKKETAVPQVHVVQVYSDESDFLEADNGEAAAAAVVSEKVTAAVYKAAAENSAKKNAVKNAAKPAAIKPAATKPAAKSAPKAADRFQPSGNYGSVVPYLGDYAYCIEECCSGEKYGVFQPFFGLKTASGEVLTNAVYRFANREEARLRAVLNLFQHLWRAVRRIYLFRTEPMVGLPIEEICPLAVKDSVIIMICPCIQPVKHLFHTSAICYGLITITCRCPHHTTTSQQLIFIYHGSTTNGIVHQFEIGRL